MGPTGSGKSYGAIRLAERIDPNFSVNRIVFTVKDFIHLMNQGLPKGSVIVFDDAGLGINSREWQSLPSKIFGMLTQQPISDSSVIVSDFSGNINIIFLPYLTEFYDIG